MYSDPIFVQLLFKNLPRTYLSSVVSGELHAGCVDDIGLQRVRQFTRRVEKTGRIVTPTHISWNRAGTILTKIVRNEPRYRSKAAGLFLDILIALSAVQIGAIVYYRGSRRPLHRPSRMEPPPLTRLCSLGIYTANRGDFRLIQQYHSFSLQVVNKGI